MSSTRNKKIFECLANFPSEPAYNSIPACCMIAISFNYNIIVLFKQDLLNLVKLMVSQKQDQPNKTVLL